MSVTAGTTKHSRSRETPAEDERREAPGRRQTILAAKARRKESRGAPLADGSGKRKNLLQRSTELSAAIGIQPCYRKRQLEPRRTA
jgi:hypothetical protein